MTCSLRLRDLVDPRLKEPDIARSLSTLRDVIPIFTIFLIASLATLSQAQSPFTAFTGLPPFSTQSGGPYDSVNLATGNVLVTLPVRQKTGKIPFVASLGDNYSASIATTAGGVKYWTMSSLASFGLMVPALSTTLAFTAYTGDVYCGGGSQYETLYSNFSVVDANGTLHPLPASVKIDQLGCYTSPPVLTTDGSGYTVSLYYTNVIQNLQYIIYDKYGTATSSQSGTYGNGSTGSIVSDSDGVGMGVNTPAFVSGQPTVTTYTDTLGTTAITATVPNGFTVPTTYGYVDADGKTVQNFTLAYQGYTVLTAFSCGFQEVNSTGPVLYPVTISVPGGGSYGISYEQTPGMGPSYITGRIAKLTLPTGGYIKYAYSDSQGHNGINCNSGVVPTLTRTVYDSASKVSSVWTYTNNNNSASTTNFTVSVVDPSNNTTEYNFVGQYQTQAKYYEGAPTGTPLESVLTCYNQNFTACATWSPSTVPLQITQTDVYTSLNGSSSNLVETKFDSYGNVNEVKQYQYPAAAPPITTPVSDTVTYYGQQWNGTGCGPYTSHYIYGTPCYSHVMNSASQDVSKTQITYTPTGHASQTKKWVSGTSWLTSSALYDQTTGVMTSTTDVNNATTSFANGSGVGACGGLLSVGTSYPLTGSVQLSTSQTWDCNGGVMTSFTDANGQVTHYDYLYTGVADPLYRILAEVDPLTDTTTFGYTTTSTESAMNFDGVVATTDSLLTVDGLGREEVAQTRQGQYPTTSTFDSTQTAYSWTTTTTTVVGGIAVKTSVPYSGSAGQLAPQNTAGTTTQYDALGRPYTITDGGGGQVQYTYKNFDTLIAVGPPPSGENLKQRQLEYDGLGRLSSVCELTGPVNGGGNCQQVNQQTGLWTKYSYNAVGKLTQVIQNVQGTSQTRLYQYDGIGRLISETNPEWGPGTATYVYDSDSAGQCTGTYNGDLIKRVDNAGNYTCYTYDALHRILNSSYSGPNATTNRYFVYDVATVDNQNMGNAKGKVAEAYTATCATCTKVTDEGMGYDALGRLNQFYESTPNSGGYYSVPLNYWANGQIENIGPFLSVAEVNITPDGEGRPSAVSGAATNIMYNYAGQPTQVDVSCEGVTCYPISYTYDPNTLRMTQYSFAGSNGTLSGTLNWNANGSLGQLTIADPVNSSDSQTCNYTADDLARIASVSCNNGTAWGQQFTYDAFGNITKSVPSGATGVSWIPGYSPTTNRYTLGGASYDSDGNVTNDTFYSYTWDAEGKALSYQGSGASWSFTYDAFGHRVELALNGKYSYSFVNLGKFRFWATGQTAEYAETPLPGGSVASQGQGDTGVQISDWLGTMRGNSNYTGGILNNTGAHAPFGEAYAGRVGEDVFTGQEDSVGDNTTYLFRERMYRSSQGRFASPDPGGLIIVDPSNPQTWNRYAYVVNNPLALIDPTGMQQAPGCALPSGGNQAICQPGYYSYLFWQAFGPQEFGSDGYCDGEQCTFVSIVQQPPVAQSGGGPCFYVLATPCGGATPNNSSKLTPAQCTAAQTLLAREAKYGTTIAAFMSAIGFGDNTVQAFNSSYTAPINTSLGQIKVDWYTDIQATGPAFSFGVGNSIAYAEGKLIWTGLRLYTGAPITNYLPFTDPAELNTLQQTFSPFSHYSDIFTPSFMQQNCGS